MNLIKWSIIETCLKKNDLKLETRNPLKDKKTVYIENTLSYPIQMYKSEKEANSEWRIGEEELNDLINQLRKYNYLAIINEIQISVSKKYITDK